MQPEEDFDLINLFLIRLFATQITSHKPADCSLSQESKDVSYNPGNQHKYCWFLSEKETLLRCFAPKQKSKTLGVEI